MKEAIPLIFFDVRLLTEACIETLKDIVKFYMKRFASSRRRVLKRKLLSPCSTLPGSPPHGGVY